MRMYLGMCAAKSVHIHVRYLDGEASFATLLILLQKLGALLAEVWMRACA